MTLGIGIIGTGKIARMHAGAMAMASGVHLAAVSSRRLAAAEEFAADFGNVTAVEGVEALLALPEAGAVYIATPTAPKEEIAMAAIAAGRHVIVEKPLPSAAAARRIAAAATAKGVVVMDATHFSHNPRTDIIRSRLTQDIGTPLTLSASFFANVGGTENIRFDPALEPQGALGDLGWYVARAAVEFLSAAEVAGDVFAAGTWENGALTSMSGGFVLPDGTRCLIDCGFRAGAFAQDLVIVGTEGILSMDDFVHDWEKGRIGAGNPDVPAGYTLRQGRGGRGTAQYVTTPSPDSHVIRLLNTFAAMAGNPASVDAGAAQGRMIRTQHLLDLLWNAVVAR